MASHRGASVTTKVAENSNILLDAIDQFQSDERRRIDKLTNNNNPSTKTSNICQVGIGSSFEETSSQQSMSDVKLTLPHLSDCQSMSLDMPNGQSGSSKHLHEEFDTIIPKRKHQSMTLDISPGFATGAKKKTKKSKPIPPISIHIRPPSVKTSIHGKD